MHVRLHTTSYLSAMTLRGFWSKFNGCPSQRQPAEVYLLDAVLSSSTATPEWKGCISFYVSPLMPVSQTLPITRAGLKSRILGIKASGRESLRLPWFFTNAACCIKICEFLAPNVINWTLDGHFCHYLEPWFVLYLLTASTMTSHTPCLMQAVWWTMHEWRITLTARQFGV